MKYKIKTYNKIHNSGLQLFSSKKYDVSADIDTPDAIILRSASLHEVELPKSVKAIARAGTGVNNIPVDACTQAGIVVFNTLGANANAVKELVFGGMIMVSRNLADSAIWINQMQSDTPDLENIVEQYKKKFVGYELQNKTLGVIGLGAIGHNVANLGVAYNMKVIGYDPFLSVTNALQLSRSVEVVDTIEEIMSKSDFITAHVAYSPNTHHLINKKLLSLCKSNCVLLNFARKDIMEEAAILEMLDKQKIHKYVTDFPSENTIHNPNIIAFPHLGASTSESEENCSTLASHAIINFIEDGTIQGSVNYPNCKLDFNNDVASRLVIGNNNVANIVAQITHILGENNINIENMINTHKHEIAYNIIDLDRIISDEIINEISLIEAVRFVRQIKK